MIKPLDGLAGITKVAVFNAYVCAMDVNVSLMVKKIICKLINYPFKLKEYSAQQSSVC